VTLSADGGSDGIVDGNPPTDFADAHSDLLADQVAHRRTSLDDSQHHVARGQLALDFTEQAGACDIDVRRCRHVPDNQAQRMIGRRDVTPDLLADMVRVEIKESGLDTHDQHAGYALVVGIALDVGIATRAPYAS